MSEENKFRKNQPKVINGWAMYDWANSVYSLVITSSIFPIYYAASTKSAFKGEIVRFLGLDVNNSVLYEYSISFSFLIIGLLSPILSGIADYGGNKKQFMRFFAYLGSLACTGLYFFDGKNIEYGILCAVLASAGFAGSLVFYNAFLPEIATEDRFDKVSAKGFSLGYIGSVILMIFNLTMLLMPQWYFPVESKYLELMALSPGSDPVKIMQEAKDSFGGIASRISFLSVGLWWFGFSHVAFRVLPNGIKRSVPEGESIFSKGFSELKKVWERLKDLPATRKFLIAYFFYNMAVQTVMYLAAHFGDVELKLPSAILIGAILTIQLVAIGGAYLFARISKARGNIFSLTFMIIIWCGICVDAFFVDSQSSFLILAGVVGLVMGGIQSLSRATYSKLLPETDDHASFFSFYDVMEKVGLIIGPALFAIMYQSFGTMRASLVPLLLFFIIGGILLQRVRKDWSLRESRGDKIPS